MVVEARQVFDLPPTHYEVTEHWRPAALAASGTEASFPKA